jgi:hypothetical protein
MCKAENVTSSMQRINTEFPRVYGRCGYCNGTSIEKDNNCDNDPNVIWCNDCDFHYTLSSIDVIGKGTPIKPDFEDCGYDIITCDSCNNKICPACDNIGDCVKCNNSLCDDCVRTFWCYECENGYCFDCEELVAADDGTYCKPCAIKLDKEELPYPE